jgi:hypothetical protein
MMTMDPKQHQDDSQRATGTRRRLATWVTVTAGLFASLIRLVPHPVNCSPVGALGLFGGARLRFWQALALPLAAMVVTDFGLWMLTGFNPSYSPWHVSRIYVYGSFMLYVPIGRALIRNNSVARIAAASLLGSLQFYLITHIGTWATEPAVGPALYTHDLNGLLNCLVAGLPFYQGDLHFDLHGFSMGTDFRFGTVGLVLGDLVFSAGLFGLYAWLVRRANVAEPVRLQPEAR